MAALDAATRASIIQQAQQRAQASGKSAEQELYNYAQTQGIDANGIDDLMGMESGATKAWMDRTFKPAPQGHVRGGAPANLGMGSGGGAAPSGAGGGGALPAPAFQGGQQPTQQPPQNGPGGGYQGMPGSAGGRYTPNPYLQQQAQNLTQMSNDNFARNIAPGMRSGAVAAGGFGGSRQGVIEANALKDQNVNLTNSLTSMFAGDFNNSQNRNLQQRQGDQSYDLGLRGNDLGFQNSDNAYDLGRRSNDLGYSNLDSNNKQFGANLGLNTMNSQANWAQQGVAAGNQMQQTPINYFNNANNNANAIAGQGSSGNSTVGSSSNPWMQASGAIGLGQQVYDRFRGNPDSGGNGNGGYNYGGVNYNNPSAFGS